jgi:integrase
MTTSTSALLKKIEEYVTHRRSLGYTDKKDVWLLRSFGRYADLHAPGEPLTRESLTYQPSLRRDSFTGMRTATVIGLLACTGLRIGEALALKNSDVNLEERLLTVRQSKNLPMRLVPITDCAADQLRRYREARDKRFARCDASEAFVRSSRGGPLSYSGISSAFRRMRNRTSLKESLGRKPRLHDLRHTFACNHLLRSYREKRDMDNAVHELSIYLGHASLACTYWYVSGVPALLKLCAKRFEAYGLPSRNGGQP